jgi:hypothetical protein
MLKMDPFQDLQRRQERQKALLDLVNALCLSPTSTNSRAASRTKCTIAKLNQ